MSGAPPERSLRLVPADALRPLVDAYPFPDPRAADAHGLLGFGADLRPERLISAYCQGIFPWYDEDPILWFSPDPRFVLRLDELRVSRSLGKKIRSGRFDVRYDTAFEAVMIGCRDSARPGQSGTWITPAMLEAYCALHQLGFAHSVESWRDGELVGGAYGVSLGHVFFGESMFTRVPDASKVAFVHLVQRLEAWGFDFVDSQVHTDHLERFGATEWPRTSYLDALADALAHPTRCGSWSLD